jgi:hypothetical protein
VGVGVAVRHSPLWVNVWYPFQHLTPRSLVVAVKFKPLSGRNSFPHIIGNWPTNKTILRHISEDRCLASYRGTRRGNDRNNATLLRVLCGNCSTRHTTVFSEHQTNHNIGQPFKVRCLDHSSSYWKSRDPWRSGAVVMATKLYTKHEATWGEGVNVSVRFNIRRKRVKKKIVQS